MPKTSTTSNKLISFFSQTIAAGTVIGILASITVSPIYAWWFNDVPREATVTPTHQRGLVLSPLAQKIVPQFVLEPLTETEVEEPPSTDDGLVVEPVNQPEPGGVALTPIAPVATPNPTPAPAPQATYSNIAHEMLAAVNRERTSRGLAALVLNQQLTNSAQNYAVKMQQLNFFSHTSPDGSTFRMRNEAAGYTNWSWMGENLAYGQTSVAEVVQDWMESEGHRANILEPRARELGVGFTGGGTPYWVQEFGVQF